MVLSKRYIVGLDLLRVAAACSVLLYHLAYLSWVQDPIEKQLWPKELSSISALTSAGWVGVEIFFVISGFVISLSADGSSASSFARRRILRLLPTVFICASVTALTLQTTHLLSPRQVFLDWLRSVAFSPVGPWIDGPYWTLHVEIAFYGVVLLCLALGMKERISQVTLAIGLLSTAFSFHWSPGTLNPGLLMRHGCFFAFGNLIYVSTQKGVHRSAALVACILLFGCVRELMSSPSGKQAVLFWALAVVIFVVVVIKNERIQGAIGARAVSICRISGLTTFPLYLLHARIGWRLIVGSRRIGLGYPLTFLMTILTLVVSAYFTASYLEPRLRSLLKESIKLLSEKGRQVA